jgi:transcriptional regulator with XRE-family HTH domain
LLDIHPIHLGRYERGQSDPRLGVLVNLARIFDVSVDFLLLGTDRVGIEDKDLLMLFRESERLDPYERISLKKLMGDFLLAKKQARESATT